jgi:hypothetical protein
MYRPKIPEVLNAVREAAIMYEAAERAIDELPGLIARAAAPLKPPFGRQMGGRLC